MKTMNLMLSAGFALLACNAFAQEAEISEAEKYARQRAEAYATALGLDERSTNKLASVYLEAEAEVAPLREQCATIKAQVDAAMVPYDTRVEELLTKDQRARLADMKKNGTWTPASSCCTHDEAAKPGCAAHGHAGAGATGAGCCAGKAGAHAPAAPPEKRLPTPTALPDTK